MENNIKTILKCALIISFIFCLFKMPYQYFQLVRALGMTVFILLGYSDFKKKNKSLSIIWVCSAILINPIIKINFGKTIWNIVDIVWAILLVITLIQDITNYKEKNYS